MGRNAGADHRKRGIAAQEGVAERRQKISFPGSSLGTHFARRLQPPTGDMQFTNPSLVRGRIAEYSGCAGRELEAGASKTSAFPGWSLGTSK